VPEASIEVDAELMRGLDGIKAGDDIILLTWLHRVTVTRIDGARLDVRPLDVIDGTPVEDIKPVLDQPNDQ
jgi:tRNA (Thr-GGU) A37 N-methylase